MGNFDIGCGSSGAGRGAVAEYAVDFILGNIVLL